jgi:hypothetical protein
MPNHSLICAICRGFSFPGIRNVLLLLGVILRWLLSDGRLASRTHWQAEEVISMSLSHLRGARRHEQCGVVLPDTYTARMIGQHTSRGQSSHHPTVAESGAFQAWQRQQHLFLPSHIFLHHLLCAVSPPQSKSCKRSQHLHFYTPTRFAHVDRALQLLVMPRDSTPANVRPLKSTAGITEREPAHRCEISRSGRHNLVVNLLQ